jgi:hypothetical protein
MKPATKEVDFLGADRLSDVTLGDAGAYKLAFIGNNLAPMTKPIAAESIRLPEALGGLLN